MHGKVSLRSRARMVLNTLEDLIWSRMSTLVSAHCRHVLKAVHSRTTKAVCATPSATRTPSRVTPSTIFQRCRRNRSTLTHKLTHTLTHTLMHTLTHALTHALTHTFTLTSSFSPHASRSRSHGKMHFCPRLRGVVLNFTSTPDSAYVKTVHTIPTLRYCRPKHSRFDDRNLIVLKVATLLKYTSSHNLIRVVLMWS